MKRKRLMCAIAERVLVCGMVCGMVCGIAGGISAAQEKGSWRAVSKTAEAITGDVALSEEKISINLVSFAMARIRGLEAAEVSAVFNAESGAGGSGSLYRLNIPSSKRFLHRNSMCGSGDTQWMATYVAGRSLQLAFFSGEKMPVFTPEAIANSTDLCGTYLYMR